MNPAVSEKAPAVSRDSAEEHSLQDIPIIGEVSPGVVRARILADNLTFWERVIIFVCLFLLAYVYGLDGTLRYVYQVRNHLLTYTLFAKKVNKPYATSGFGTHSTLATINVIRAVIAAAAQVRKHSEFNGS